jgi:hypothetical protein
MQDDVRKCGHRDPTPRVNTGFRLLPFRQLVGPAELHGVHRLDSDGCHCLQQRAHVGASARASEQLGQSSGETSRDRRSHQALIRRFDRRPCREHPGTLNRRPYRDRRVWCRSHARGCASSTHRCDKSVRRSSANGRVSRARREVPESGSGSSCSRSYGIAVA